MKKTTKERDTSVRARSMPMASSTAEVKTSTRTAWWVTGLLFTFMVINFADKAILGLVATPLREEFGLDAAGYGYVASSFYLLFSISAFVVGLLGDRIPTRWLLLGLAVVWAVTQMPMLWTTSTAILVATRITLGAAEGPAFGTANHALHKWFDDRNRQLPSSIIATGACIGPLIAAPVLSWVIVQFGWRAGFGVLGALGLIWSLLWLTVRREGPHSKVIEATEPAVASTTATSANPVSGTADGGASFFQIIRSGTWIGATLLAFAAYWGMAIAVSWLPVYMQDSLGYSTTAMGNMVAVTWAIAALFMLGCGWLSQRLTTQGVPTRVSRGLLGSVVVLLGGAATFIGVHSGSPTLGIILLMIGLGAPSALYAMGQTLISEITPLSHRGAVLGLSVGISTIAGIIAPTVMGWMVEAGSDQNTGFTQGFTVMAYILIISSIAGAVLIHPQKDRIRCMATSPDAN
ncbi:MFS transporter [Tomitella cavernea]|uniref:MFS transporter n=1 Tax=Tomitella cavernea TaxID=1387982 RepID=A0ABP9BZS9_9ACTN|nr:MFS transporter [Tomitella cavernea]